MGLALTSCIVPPPARRRSRSATTRSRSASASTASRAGGARSSLRSTTWPSGSSRRSSDLGLKSGDTVLAFVNGMGGTPLIELYGAFNSVNKILGGQGIKIGRSLVGNYITSLEMAGSRSRCCGSTTSSRSSGRAGPTPALRWGV